MSTSAASIDQPSAVIDWIEARTEFAAVAAVGHRLVHGLTRKDPVPVTREVIAELGVLDGQ
jgi:acetate kinase